MVSVTRGVGYGESIELLFRNVLHDPDAREEGTDFAPITAGDVTGKRQTRETFGRPTNGTRHCAGPSDRCAESRTQRFQRNTSSQADRQLRPSRLASRKRYQLHFTKKVANGIRSYCDDHNLCSGYRVGKAWLRFDIKFSL